MSSSTWRGTVGVIKPSYESGSLVEFVRLLPAGIGVIPLYMGLKDHDEKEYREALETYKVKVAELAKIGVDLIHPEGAPPFLIRGYKAEQEIVKSWEDEYKIPIVTSGMTQTQALHAMGIKKLFGVTFHAEQNINELFARYFIDAGFDMVGFETVPIEMKQRRSISSEEVYFHIKRFCLKHSDVDGIYLQGSGSWRVKDIVPLEQDLGIPIIHPVAARLWYVQKRFHVREPVSGAGRLLEQMP